MKLLIALLVMQSAGAECASALVLHGVGSTAAERVKPYVACLNTAIGVETNIRAACGAARGAVMAGAQGRRDKAGLDQAVDWLDAMIKQRSECETHLDVKP